VVDVQFVLETFVLRFANPASRLISYGEVGGMDTIPRHGWSGTTAFGKIESASSRISVCSFRRRSTQWQSGDTAPVLERTGRRCAAEMSGRRRALVVGLGIPVSRKDSRSPAVRPRLRRAGDDHERGDFRLAISRTPIVTRPGLHFVTETLHTGNRHWRA